MPSTKATDVCCANCIVLVGSMPLGKHYPLATFRRPYARFGRAWTSENSGPDRFALPDLRYLSARPGTVDSVTRELLGGDLVSGGRLFGPPDSAHLLYCVYVAKDVSELDSPAGEHQQRSSH